MGLLSRIHNYWGKETSISRDLGEENGPALSPKRRNKLGEYPYQEQNSIHRVRLNVFCFGSSICSRHVFSLVVKTQLIKGKQEHLLRKSGKADLSQGVKSFL